MPAAILIIGCYFAPETPNSLVERGHKDQAAKTLAKIRGTEGEWHPRAGPRVGGAGGGAFGQPRCVTAYRAGHRGVGLLRGTTPQHLPGKHPHTHALPGLSHPPPPLRHRHFP